MVVTRVLVVSCIYLLSQSATVQNTVAQTVGSLCNNDRGECKYVAECPSVLKNFDLTRLKFCNRTNSIVCCPKKITLTTWPTHAQDQSKVIVRECTNYRNMVYQKCDPQPLILAGKRAEPKELPHMARLGFKGADGTTNWFCGGTLISPNYVLSAAHCFYGKVIPNHVRLGDLDFASTTDDAQPQDFSIRNYIQHPEYSIIQKYNDIVLIELDRTVTFNHYVAPACLPLSNGTDYDHFIAAGWGTTEKELSSEHLLKVKLDRFDDDECKEQNSPTDTMEKGLLVRTQICAGSHDDRRDTCQGDSGGPLFVQHPVYPCMYLLIGITSFGATCGIANIPGIYMRVKLYADWIERIVWNATTSL